MRMNEIIVRKWRSSIIRRFRTYLSVSKNYTYLAKFYDFFLDQWKELSELLHVYTSYIYIYTKHHTMSNYVH